MRRLIRYSAASLALAAGGCAACETCRGQTATPQTYPAPPMPSPFAPPPADAPKAAPAPAQEGTGTVTETTTRKVEGAATVINQHAPGVIVVGSPGVAVPAAPAAQAARYPLVPGPVPDSVVFFAARRIAGGLYYAATGKCPTRTASQAPAVAVPVTPTTFATPPAQAEQHVFVHVVHDQGAAPAASPQAPRKRSLFGH